MFKKTIKLTESEFKNILNNSIKNVISTLSEGVEWTRSYGYGNGRGKSNMINLRINQDTTDKGNQSGNMNADTRVFGTRYNILNGDETKHGNTIPLAQKVKINKNVDLFYQQVIDYCDGKIPFDEIDFDSVPVKQANTIKEYFKSGLSPEQIKYNIQAKYNLMSLDSNMRQMTYDRVLQSENPKKVKRYNIGIIPGTNVKFIALYNMNDFNFSDALKHGKIRQNDKTEEIMGYKSTKRGDRLPVTYDNKNTIPDIKDNFSLNNVKPQHFKTQYDFADKNSYTSIHQFLDKSIIYAASVLKDENFIPDYIVAPPSSSKFNNYYSINLSRKLGCEYIENFFKKSTFQVKVNGGQDTEIMKKHGFTDKDIFIFENKVKMLAFKQITNEIRTPIYKFVTNPVFKARIIESEKKLPILKGKNYEQIVNMIIDDIFTKSISYVQNKEIAQQIINKGLETYDYKGVLGNTILNQKTRKPLDELHYKIAQLLEKYSQVLISKGGFKIYAINDFKITDFDKRERMFLDNCYVVADKELSKNGGLLSRYKGKKFLIFDEDINSGGTLKMVINALMENTNDVQPQNVMCLCNAYSKTGK